MKKTFFLIVAVLAFLASAIMYFVGKDSSHLSELYDFFWLPLPLGFLSLITAFTGKK